MILLQAEGLKLVNRDPDRVRTYFRKVELIVPAGLEGSPVQSSP